MRLARAFQGFIMGAALAGQPVLAQANCQSTRAALALLEATRGSYWSVEQVARARAAMAAIARMEEQINENFNRAANVLLNLEYLRGLPPSPERDAQIASANARAQDFTRSNAELGERIRMATVPFELYCLPGDYACSRQLYGRLAEMIATADERRAQYPAFLQQISAYQAILSELRCDQAGGAGTAGAAIPAGGALSGTWLSSYNNIRIVISQNGVEVSGRTSDGYSYGGHMNGSESVTLTYTANGGTGAQTGRISYDANGRAVLIDFGGGISWSRQ
jgi:hypothetical protein